MNYGTQWLLSRLADLLPGFPRVRVLVALSGGVDSTALLAALGANPPKELRVRAVHVNHGLHSNAPQWAQACRVLSRGLSVPLQVIATKVARASGVSLEAAAREARYGVLAQALEAGEFLLTAHHEDDQLETVLLQLFRGAGVAGLAAMPEIAPFAAGWHARPLLSRARAELVEFVRGVGLSWVEDDTNTDETLDRNYLRRRVLPLMCSRWPGVGSAVSRSARHAAEAQRLLDIVARGDVDRAASGADLFVPALRALQPDRRRNALRFWITRSGLRVPDTSRLEELAGPVIDARPDANPRVAWGEVEVQRHADLLSIRSTAGRRRASGSRGVEDPRDIEGRRGAGSGATAAAKACAIAIDWAWRVAPVLELPDEGGTLELQPDPHGPIDLDALPAHVTVRHRQGGERLRPRRGGPRRALKSLLQESRLALAERGRLPLVFSGSKLLAVSSLWVDESVQITPTTVHRGRLTLSRPGGPRPS